MKNAVLILILFVLPALTNAQETVTSSMFHGGKERLGVYGTKENRGFGSPKWIVPTEGKVLSSPVLHKGYVYVGSEDSNL